MRDFGWEDHSRFIGIGTRETLTVLREEYRIEAPVDELLAYKNALYLELAGASTAAFPEMRALVERLHGCGVPMAVASGSSRAAIAATLAVTGLDAYLPLYVSAEEVAHGKPEPDVFLEAARFYWCGSGHMCGAGGRRTGRAGGSRGGHALCRDSGARSGGGPGGVREGGAAVPGRAGGIHRHRGVRLALHRVRTGRSGTPVGRIGRSLLRPGERRSGGRIS